MSDPSIIKNFIKSNRFNCSALVLIIIVIGFHLIEAFDNTLYNDWFRQNIHLFTPAVPAVFLVIGIIRKERFLLVLINLFLLFGHYYSIQFLSDIGKAGAGVLEML